MIDFASMSSSINAFDLTDPESLESYAKQLEGMTFREVLDLGIAPEGVSRDYNDARYKGGMGTLIEERFFGYKANSDQDADFPEAGVELKATCMDRKKDGDYSAGERLVLTMIPYDEPIEDDFFSSHVWRKSEKILLIYYERDRTLEDKYDQVIRYVKIITPSKEDLKIIREDYDKIVSIIKAGKAEELSESLTSYLGACTKGATAEKSLVKQFYPPHALAKKRAFCFKRSYMDYILHAQMMGTSKHAESIIKNADELESMTFEQYVLSRIQEHAGKTDVELCQMFGLDYKNDKSQWSRIVYALLGIRGDRAEEFEKANVSVRTVRVRKRGGIKESLSLNTITFMDLIKEHWEESWLREYFEETRFLFVSFKETDDGYVLADARFWSMPQSDIEGPLKECWQRTKDVVTEGVELTEIPWGNGTRIENNLPAKTENAVAHVRPHTSKAWYRFADGTTRGDSPSFGDVLPDGREMTKQSFWLNNDYVYAIVDPDEKVE